MFRYINAHRIWFIAVMALIFITDIFLIGGSVITQLLVDAVMEQNLSHVRLYIPIAIGYSLFSAAIYITCAICQDVFGAKLMNDMRLSVFDGIMRRSRTDFAQHHSADYVSALTNDISLIHGQFLNMFYMVVLSVASMILSVAIMFYYQPIVAICAVFSALIMTVSPFLLGSMAGKWEKRRSERLAALTTILSECFAGFETIVAFGIQRHIRKRFEEYSNALCDCEYRTEGVGALANGLSQLLSGLAQTIILSLSCWLVFTGRMSVGALVVFISLNTTFCSNLAMCLQGVPILKGVCPVINRVNGYADYVNKDKQGHVEPTFKNTVIVQDLCFGYNAENTILKNLSLTLKQGGKYALTGNSGSGKSTLIHLLTGDNSDYDGGIFYDGTELRELKRDDLNRVTACIHQDIFLFDDTIRNNICLFDDFSNEQFEWAIKTSGVQKFTDAFSEGVSYIVGENGERLSGGQKQRIAIARALIRNTNFLILDEGTSALDEQTAMEIEGELLKQKNLTLLTITHHLKNPQEYDDVFVLNDGEIPTTA